MSRDDRSTFNRTGPREDTAVDDKPRRGLLKAALAAMAGMVLGRKAAPAATTRAGTSRLVTEGEVLRQNVYQGRPPREPLDTMIRFERSDENNGRPVTHEILSLMHEEKGKRSYPWTIYSHLTTHHVEGDACVLCSRLTKNGPGWSCGLHSEVFCHDRAVGLGVNVEMTNHYGGPGESKMIGVNILGLGPQPCAYGMQIHDKDGVGFDTAVALNTTSRVGIDLGGRYDVGIHARGNRIRVNEGTRIELDGEGRIAMRYRAGRIEFLNGERCVGHIDVSGDDHAM